MSYSRIFAFTIIGRGLIAIRVVIIIAGIATIEHQACIIPFLGRSNAITIAIGKIFIDLSFVTIEAEMIMKIGVEVLAIVDIIAIIIVKKNCLDIDACTAIIVVVIESRMIKQMQRKNQFVEKKQVMNQILVIAIKDFESIGLVVTLSK